MTLSHYAKKYKLTALSRSGNAGGKRGEEALVQDLQLPSGQQQLPQGHRHGRQRRARPRHRRQLQEEVLVKKLRQIVAESGCGMWIPRVYIHVRYACIYNVRLSSSLIFVQLK